MALYDHQQSPRLGQPAPVESTSVRMFSGVDIPEAAWAGQMIYRTDTQGLQVYNGTAWEDVVGGAFGVLTYVGPDIPVANGAGDLWFDTDDGRKLYVAAVAGANSIGTGQWELSQDSATAQAAADAAQTTATNANTLASGKNRTFVQISPPTSLAAGDIWLDSDDGYKMYRANIAGANTIGPGQWILVQDAGIAQAQTTANGKNRVYYQAAAPTGGTYVVGDTWFDTDDGYKPYNWDGAAWQPVAFGSSSLAVGSVTASQILAGAVNADKIASDYVYAGSITADQIDAGTLGADYLMSGSISTGTSGQRVVIDRDGLVMYASDETVRINIPANSPEAYLRANIISRGLTVESGMTIQGDQNIFAMGSVSTLQTKITGSAVAGTVTTDWPVLNPSGFGMYLGVPNSFCAQGTAGSSATIDAMAYTFFGSAFLKIGGGTVYTFPYVDRGDGTQWAQFFNYGGMVDVYLSGVAGIRHVMWGSKTLGNNNYSNVLRTYNMTGVNQTTAPTQMGTDVTFNPESTSAWGKLGRNLAANNCFVSASSSGTTFYFRKWNVDGTTGAISLDTSMASPWSSGVLSANWGSTGTSYAIRGVAHGTATSMGFAVDSTNVFVVAVKETVGSTTNFWARVFQASNGTRLPNYDFPLNPTDSPFTVARSSGTGGYGGFKSVQNNDGSTMTEYTELTWTTESSNWWSGYTWRDTLLNTVQRITLTGATGGTFTLTFKGLNNEVSQTTAAINYNASKTDVQTALEGLAALVPGDVVVKGGPLPGTPVDVFFSSDATYVDAGVTTPILINVTSAYGGKSLQMMSATNSLTGTSPTIGFTDQSSQHESKGSSFTSWTMTKRKSYTCTTPSLPTPAAGTSYARGHDDVSGVNFYVGRGSAAPTNANMFKRSVQPADGAITYTYTTTPSFSGTALSAAPDNFPNSASAVLQSSAINSTTSLPKVKITGDGFIHAENLDVSGGGVAYIEKLILQSTQNAGVSSGNAPALRVGDVTAAHLRIGDGQIIAMTNDTTQGNLLLNIGGGVRIGNTSSRTMTGIHYNVSTGTTDANSDVSFTHPLGVNPDVVLGTPGTGDTSLFLVAKDASSVTFRCRRISTGALWGSGQGIQVFWLALDF